MKGYPNLVIHFHKDFRQIIQIEYKKKPRVTRYYIKRLVDIIKPVDCKNNKRQFRKKQIQISSPRKSRFSPIIGRNQRSHIQ